MGLDLPGNDSSETMYDEGKIETWLSDSRVGNNSAVDHRSRPSVLSPLRNCVDNDRDSRIRAGQSKQRHPREVYSTVKK